MKVDAAITVRHPYVGEVPVELITGFEALPLDRQWQWVLIHDGKVKAQMLCANAHGLLLIIRLTALKDAPAGWAVRFFREVMRDARAMGCIGFTTFLSDQNPQEVKLMRIVQRLGGMLNPQTGAWVAGSTEIGY